MLNIIIVNVQELYPFALSEAGTGNRSGFSVYPFGVTVISEAIKNLPSGNRVYPFFLMIQLCFPHKSEAPQKNPAHPPFPF
jgi:hypothetical protein